MQPEPQPHGHSSRSSGSTQISWSTYSARRLLRRLGWLVVFVGTAYCMLVLTWIALDPRW